MSSIALDASGGLRIDAAGAAGPFTLAAESAILALPPRLASRSIQFAPDLPRELQATLDAVPTWMAAHAKVMAIYDLPFWRVHGYSGSASSVVGPLAEIHDASPLDGLPALFGFVGLPAASREAIGMPDLKHMAVAQLVRLFGPAAAEPVAVSLFDWAADPDTATTADRTPPGEHPTYGPPPEPGAPWKGRLEFAGTEIAPHSGGYLEGALEAAVAAVSRVLAHIPRNEITRRSADRNPREVS